MATTAYLGGIPLVLPASWGATSGVAPQRQYFEIAAGDADRARELAKQRNKVTLELAGKEWKALSVLRVEPSNVSAKRRVLVVDRRHWWARPHYYRSVNLPRSVGQLRREGDLWNELRGLNQFAPDLTFYAHSLAPDGAAWAVEDLITDVLGVVDPTAKWLSGGADLAAVPLQGIVLDGNGDEVMQQLLSRFGAIDLTIDPAGQVVLYSWRNRTEFGILGKGDSTGSYGDVGAGVFGAGTVEVVDFRAEAPEYVDCLVTPKLEVRFDFTADPTEVTETSSLLEKAGRRVERLMRNVIVNPKPSLELTNGTIVTSGDYVELTSSLAAYAVLGGQGTVTAGLTQEHLRQAVLPRNGAILHQALATLDERNPDPGATYWAEIISALMSGFRVLYQLPREWADSALAIEDSMVGTWNVESGQRARAQAWCDHTIFPNAQGRWLKGKTAETMPWCIEIDSSYPGEGVDPTEDNDPSPFIVRVDDEDQGVIRVAGAPNVETEAKVLIGLMTNLPSGAIRKSNAGAVFLNSAAIGQESSSLPSLSTSMRLCLILTMTPANALFRVRVYPKDLGIEWPCEGPPQEVRVNEETARFGWAQERATLVEHAFGLGGGEMSPRAALAALSDACINLKGNNQGAASLTEIAKGYALDVFSRYEPRLMGARRVDLRGAAGGVIPSGGIAGVQHTVDQRGVATTSLMLRAMRPAMNVLALIGDGARSIILRLIGRGQQK